MQRGNFCLWTKIILDYDRFKAGGYSKLQHNNLDFIMLIFSLLLGLVFLDFWQQMLNVVW